MISNIRKPVPHHRRPAPKKQQPNHTVFREVVSIAVVGILLAVVMTDAVVGMSSGFAPSSEVVLMTAGVVADGR